MDEAQRVEQLVDDAGAGVVAAADLDHVVADGVHAQGAAALRREGEVCESITHSNHKTL